MLVGLKKDNIIKNFVALTNDKIAIQKQVIKSILILIQEHLEV